VLKPLAPIIFPSPSSSNHHDIPSLLEYAERTGLNQNSTVFIGTHFEYTVMATLACHGFSLQRVGGANDCGVDLIGTWDLPLLPEPMKVVVSCKATKRPGPHFIRELTGALATAAVGWRGPSTMGFLVLNTPATDGIMKFLMQAQTPMAFIKCAKEGRMEQFIWNTAAREAGLVGLSTLTVTERDGTVNVFPTWDTKRIFDETGKPILDKTGKCLVDKYGRWIRQPRKKKPKADLA